MEVLGAAHDRIIRTWGVMLLGPLQNNLWVQAFRTHGILEISFTRRTAPNHSAANIKRAWSLHSKVFKSTPRSVCTSNSMNDVLMLFEQLQM